LGLTGVSLNFLNVLAFPLIIGIGIDDAVHVMHRYIKEGSIPGVYTLIGRAIFYTTLTTGAAFGSLLLGKYRGYPSFAIVILVGISLAFLYTLFLLPPLLRLVRRESSREHH
ncbi:MAG TPA: multidrug RND transporter, partial [candidate division WOR-3 bacterium]|nr:multidrug RND transporter [candidate division WOR-3 bacterium]